MATRKSKIEEKDPNAPSLKEILSDGVDSSGPTYHGANSVAVLRLIYAVTALGGMVTFWTDSANQRLCFSMRLWGERRSYDIDDPSQVSLTTEPIVAKLSKVLHSKKYPPPPPLEPLRLVKTDQP